MEDAGPDEILFAGRTATGELRTAGCVVEKGLNECTEGVDDVPDAVSDVLGEGSAVDVVVEETGAVCECGGVLGEIVEEGDGGGVGGCGWLECEGELGGEVVDEGEEGVEIGDDEVERGGVGIGIGIGIGVGDGFECGGAGLGEEGEGAHHGLGERYSLIT